MKWLLFAIALIYVPFSITAVNSQLSVEYVSSGKDLVAALDNPGVGTALLAQSLIRLSDHDFNGVSLPVVILRNVTIAGDPTLRTWPLLDFGHVRGKLRLGDNVVVTLRHMVCVNQRTGALSQSPGLDLILPSGSVTALAPTGALAAAPPGLNPSTAAAAAAASGAALPMLLGVETAYLNPLCYPFELQAQSTALARPAVFPGMQRIRLPTAEMIASGCMNVTGTPAASTLPAALSDRCWPSVAVFADVAVQAVAFDAALGQQTPAGYFAAYINVTGLCEQLMTMACVQRYGPFGCYTVTDALRKQPGAPQPPLPWPPSQPPPPPAVFPEPLLVLGRRSSGGDDAAARTGAIVGGAIGGLLVLTTAVMAALLRRRCVRSQQDANMNISLHSHGVAPTMPPEAPSGGGVGKLSYGDVSNSFMLQTSSDLTRCKSDFTRAASGLPSSLSAAVAAGSFGAGARGSMHKAPGETAAASTAATSSTGAGPSAASSDQETGSGQSGQTATVRRSKASTVTHGSGAPARSSALQLVPIAEPTDPLETLPVTQSTPHRSDVQLGVTCGGRGDVTLLPIVRGRGAFGRVVEGMYRGCRVAVKLVPYELAAAEAAGGGAQVGGKGGRDRAQAVETFRQEAEVLGRCDHPNVVRLLAACVAPPRPALVFELMESSLEALMADRRSKAGGSLPVKKALHIAVEILRGLEYLHPTIVHRDLKPANVLLNDPYAPRPVVKITDFGLSRLRMTAVETRTPEAGTPAFMPPECFDVENSVISHHADMYSFGCLLWSMLAGECPWRGCDSMTIAALVTLHRCRPSLLALPPDEELGTAGPAVKRLLAGCWEQDPLRRPAAAEAAKELAALLRDLEEAPPAPPLAPVGSAGPGSPHPALLAIEALPL